MTFATDALYSQTAIGDVMRFASRGIYKHYDANSTDYYQALSRHCPDSYAYLSHVHDRNILAIPFGASVFYTYRLASSANPIQIVAPHVDGDLRFMGSSYVIEHGLNFVKISVRGESLGFYFSDSLFCKVVSAMHLLVEGWRDLHRKDEEWIDRQFDNILGPWDMPF